MGKIIAFIPEYLQTKKSAARGQPAGPADRKKFNPRWKPLPESGSRSGDRDTTSGLNGLRWGLTGETKEDPVLGGRQGDTRWEGSRDRHKKGALLVHKTSLHLEGMSSGLGG